VLEQAIRDDWTEDERRFAEYERTGEFISLEEFLQPFEATFTDAKRSA